MKKRFLSIVLAVLMLLSVLPVTAMAADGPTDTPVTMTSENTDGPKLKKTAQWENKNAGIAKITMEVWGEPSQQSTEFGPTDIVLVVDCSGSMLGTPIEKAKGAAKEFVEQFLGSKGTASSKANVKIGVVIYNEKATTAADLSNSKDALNTEIGKINATYDTGTNIQAGIHAAQTMLDNDKRTGVAKYMVVLSDGEPTYSYRFDATANYVGCDALGLSHWGGHYENFAFQPNYKKTIGSGSGFDIDFNVELTKAVCTKHNDTLNPLVHTTDFVYNGGVGDAAFTKRSGTNNGVATIWEANQAKAKGTTIYSIGFGKEIGTAQKPNNAYKTMVAIASSADKYKAASESDVSNVFDAIATEIKSYTAYNAVVTDPMGAGFTVIESNADYPITVANGETTNVDANGNLVWNVAKELDENHHTITFYIQYNTSTASNNNNPLPTNNGAELTFTTDKEGKVQGTPVTVGDPELPNPSKKVSYDDGHNGQYTGSDTQYNAKYHWPTTDVTIAADLTSGPAGYEFDGWYRGDEKAMTFSMPEQNVELVAHWKKTDETRQLTITKNWAEESKKADSVTIAVKNGTATVDTVTLSAENDWSAKVDVPKYSYNDTTNTATEINYTIEETGVNGTNSLNDVVNGVIVGAWTPSYEPATDTGRAVTNTYTAEQTYGVEYKYVSSDPTNHPLPDAIKTPNGTGDYAVSDTDTYYVGATVRRNSPAKDIYEDTANKGTWRLTWAEAEAKMTKGGVTFTGTWTFTAEETYKVTYTILDGEKPFDAADLVPAEVTGLHKGQPYTVVETPTSADAGKGEQPGTWILDGWYFDRDLKNEAITFDIEANTELFGKWLFMPNMCSVVYHLEGETPEGVTLNTATVTGIEYGTNYTTNQPSENNVSGTKDGKSGTWTFSGWYHSEAYAGEPVMSFDVTLPREDLYGKWTFKADEQPPETKYEITLTISKELRVRSGSHPGEWTFWFDVSYKPDNGSYTKIDTIPITLANRQTDKQKTVTVTVDENAYYAILRGAPVCVEERDLRENGFEYDTTPRFGGVEIYIITDATGGGHIGFNPNWQGEIAPLTIKPIEGSNFDFVNYYGKSGKVEKPVKVGPQLNRDDHVAYIMGYPDGTVQPEGQITRAEACTIFFRLLTEESRDYYFTKVNNYTDVARGDWFNNAISTLSNAGIVTGYNDGTFRPNQPITRGEMAKIIANFANLSKGGKSFTDLRGHWSKTYVELAAGNGWIAGYPDGSFRPDQKITRAETVTMINRVLERVPAKESRLLSRSVMLTFPDNKPGDWYYIAIQEASNSHEYQRSVYETTGDEMWTKLIDNVDWTKLEK